MKIALYVRVSTERQVDERVSMVDQITVLKKWALDKGHTIVEIFEERGASAYALERKRPVFERMVDAALSPEKPFDLILVHTQSRFYRNNAERERLEVNLEKHGVQLLVFSQPRPEDKGSSFIFRNVTGFFDELQSIQTGTRVSQCMKENAIAGYYNGARPPYGYKVVATDIPARSGVKRLLVLDDGEAEVVRRIFRLAQFGKDGTVMGMKRIAEELNTGGTLHRGVKWTVGHVEHVLSNSVYVGKYITFRRDSHNRCAHPKDRWITTNVEPLLDEAEFDAVHKLLEARRPPNTRTE